MLENPLLLGFISSNKGLKFMKKIRSIMFAAMFAVVFSVNALAEMKPVKYVFLFIGDGMSIPQRMMTDYFLKKSGQEGLVINNLDNSAVTHTYSASSFITDSAASGTAIACGEKTYNGAIGVGIKKQPLESVAYVAKKSGKKVGIVTSVTINHATPAAFYAHNASRGNYYEIALDMIDSNFDYFGGGGVAQNDNEKSKNYKGDIYELAKKAGFDVYRKVKRDEFDKIKAGDKKIMAFGYDQAIPYALDAEEGNLMLADFVKKGIEVLDNPKGFFIMAEGGKIDWVCHGNDAMTVIRETEDLDKAVKVALDFAKKHPDETLIVVTGDHETGGLSLGFADTGYKSYIERLANQKQSADVFGNEIKKMRKADKNLKFEDTIPAIEKFFGLKFESDKKDPMLVSKKERERLEKSFDDTKAFPRAVRHCFANKAGVAWSSHAHTALPVLTTASGKCSDEFKGTIDNTDIAKKLKKAVR